MKIYLVSLAAGILAGLIYALIQVRSPAPPAIALVGLLGMLIGEQAGPILRKALAREPVTAAWLRTECVARITGVEAKPASTSSDSTKPESAPGDRVA